MNALDNEKAKAFIEEIIKLSRKYNLCLGHEDIGGNFEIHPYNKEKVEWLRRADVEL